jgi:nucleotidyltransferase/DNA polymerase involved in DNA repair
MDGDAFFVGCEVAKNPKLKGLPVVTGEERGIVSALSYEAKALGIVRGMPIFSLRKKFPEVLVLPEDYASYARFSTRMFDIVRKHVGEVEEYSIDECFADLTGLDRPLKMSYKEIAKMIKKEIKEELSLSVSVGLAPTKVLAKVASSWQKPDGLTVIDGKSAPDFLKKTPIEKIWGIGPRTAAFLRKQGIQTGGEFARRELAWVREKLSRPYEAIWRELNGACVMEVDPLPKRVFSSVQKTRTFHPATGEKTFLLSELSKHIEEACRKARYYQLVPKRLSFFLKSRDFEYFSYTVKLASPTNAPETLVALVEKYFKEVWKQRTLFRTAGAALQELTPAAAMQPDLFGGAERVGKFEKIHSQIDTLEEKFGKRVVYLASTHKSLKRKKKGTDSDDLDRNLLFL